jgi:hypothetical protein
MGLQHFVSIEPFVINLPLVALHYMTCRNDNDDWQPAKGKREIRDDKKSNISVGKSGGKSFKEQKKKKKEKKKRRKERTEAFLFLQSLNLFLLITWYLDLESDLNCRHRRKTRRLKSIYIIGFYLDPLFFLFFLKHLAQTKRNSKKVKANIPRQCLG